ncbi:transcription factor RcaD [Iningainema tapete]|uniref:Transcription factor RcaD n=1 Tax=Iningainema tapete BLCC-T55 TaxID=2748662 RepID=A0A8J6XS60_9CYAN|nr:transcription factor RcaD [Iningainema tapete]MBD2778587.1 transcription factor RcaD [Iningainema tapete BLCC-T55]
METNELKFLLKLLGCTNYRTSLTASGFKDFKGKEKICRDLGDRELIDFSREIATVKILPPGDALLKLDPAQLPITDRELRMLEKISKASGKIEPSKIKSSLKAAEKGEILKTLSERGLIEVENKMKKTKAEVWLTQRGEEYLRSDYNPKGSAAISLDLLNNYLSLFRKTLRSQPESIPTTEEEPVVTIVNLTDEEILQTIRKLDQELGTDNYLPIFHLRQKLQPPLSRDELDKVLYRLEESDSIELSTLAEPGDYTPEQVDAGISQISGGSLFFITVI